MFKRTILMDERRRYVSFKRTSVHRSGWLKKSRIIYNLQLICSRLVSLLNQPINQSPNYPSANCMFNQDTKRGNWAIYFFLFIRKLLSFRFFVGIFAETPSGVYPWNTVSCHKVMPERKWIGWLSHIFL